MNHFSKSILNCSTTGFVNGLITLLIILVCASKLNGQSQWLTPQNEELCNSKDDDFAPVWSVLDSALVFNSSRTGKAHFYKVTSLSAVELFNGIAQEARRQYSYMSCARSGERCYSTFRHTELGAVLNIVSVTVSNGVWSPPEFIDALQSDRFSSHASLSPDGSIMVFVSDRDGGEGGTDLWISTKRAGTWNAPVNLGEGMNSSGNEITPFLSSNDTLYFASNGFGGRGGYDVFMSILVAGEWQPPVPIEACNTAYDESDFSVLPNGDALFASNRPGGKGALDIYRMKKRSGTD